MGLKKSFSSHVKNITFHPYPLHCSLGTGTTALFKELIPMGHEHSVACYVSKHFGGMMLPIFTAEE
jgi:hypothetical protein